MIGTIVLTATLTATICTALLHRRNSYVYSVEQTSLNRADEITLLRSELTIQQDRIALLERRAA